ncbi:NAD(P)-dependent oxidoreductase [Streptomyces sp. NBC_01142]|uniref:NAD-dependent epimerase/dehydratase family protein n=1 Tax=Streptomyces sp. NBC_01142 TaxID=2975865 RepID=UPI0022570FA4|nr:NAD(P)-dependent oxidoreductase [Streptomyces sp. NBC_01142]MCX4820236.1 NAD(P)-dependent oxidoreductase [Streptomyces sp. NBC_01142]
MKILVTGATGFIGKALLPCLVAAGKTPIAVVRPKQLVVPEVDSVHVDLANDVLERKLPRDITQVIHLAANVSNCHSAECFTDNVYTTYAVAKWAQTLGVRIVYASTTGVYGHPRTPRDAVESEEIRPQNLYALSKHLGEVALATSSVSAVMLRFSYVYGEGDRNSAVARIVRHVLEGRPVVVRDESRDLLYIDDAVSAILSAVEYFGKVPVFNIGSGSLAALADVAKEVMKMTQQFVPLRIEGPRRAGYRINATRAGEELTWHVTTPLSGGLRRLIQSHL